ncbi:MAG: DUF4160 domain-containing protein [Rhodocyclaceae bacterium]|nr:DUF4160 domain-containing protein [Rhodocyclaceae bacterium]
MSACAAAKLRRINTSSPSGQSDLKRRKNAHDQHVLRNPGGYAVRGQRPPHIHVRYAGAKASIAIEDGHVLAGSIPPKQLKMVQAWIEIHKDELFADWELAVEGEQPFRIAPLQ